MWKWFEEDGKEADLTHSLGMVVKEDGSIEDVAVDSPAFRAGVTPAERLIAVNSRQFTLTGLREAVAATSSGKRGVELLVKNGEYYKTVRVEYQGGERYPHLIRDESKPDVLSKIVEPLVK